MKHTQGHKDRRRNHGGSKRGVNYVPKYYKPYDPNTSSAIYNASTESKTSAKSSEAPTGTTYSSSKDYGKLTRSILITLYAKSPVPSSCLENIKKLTEVYSEESILPQAMGEFNLPMSKAIMPPRRINTHQPRESREHYYRGYNAEDDDDQGIANATDNSHSNLSNAPLWFDSQVILPKDGSEVKADELFSIESLASKQISLEEEKAKFNKQSATITSEAIGTKVSPNSLFENIEDEEGYSSVDVKYETSMKNKNKMAEELFNNPTVTSTEDHTAIDVGNLEAQILKGVQQEEDKGEEMPVWNTYSAEEIKQQAQQDFSSWTVDLNPSNETPGHTIDKLFAPNFTYNTKPLVQKQMVKETMNLFCHSSLNITETDRVWYYCDTQRMIQGPFNSIEMYNWYNAGYFPPTLPTRCGKYSPFVSLGDLLNSIKLRQQQELENQSVHHFNASNIETFFDPAVSSVDPKSSTILIEDLEANIKSAASYNHEKREQFSDPAIDSLESQGYIKDEAHDLKALLGFHNNSRG